MREESKEYKVVGKKKESATITTLYLVPADGSKFPYVSGQFLTVYFPELGVAEGKAYSLSSSPHENELAISVKEIGAYSKKLASLKEEDTVTATGPYGFFYSEEKDTHLVMVAGGIGVAPFRSMILSHLHENKGRKLSLYYSVRTLEDAAFLAELLSQQENNPLVSVVIHATREVPHSEHIRHGRITAEELFEHYKQGDEVEYLLCGSIPFVRDMWKGLKEKGVPEEKLYTEAFFS